MAGVFVTDPGAGFPPGAPAGAPEQISWHGLLHEVGFVVATLSWLGTCVVFARYFAAIRQPGWFWACTVTPVAVVVLASWPHQESLSVRLVIASAIQFGLLAAAAIRLMRAVNVDRSIDARAERATIH